MNLSLCLYKVCLERQLYGVFPYSELAPVRTSEQGLGAESGVRDDDREVYLGASCFGKSMRWTLRSLPETSMSNKDCFCAGRPAT